MFAIARFARTSDPVSDLGLLPIPRISCQRQKVATPRLRVPKLAAVVGPCHSFANTGVLSAKHCPEKAGHDTERIAMISEC